MKRHTKDYRQYDSPYISLRKGNCSMVREIRTVIASEGVQHLLRKSMRNFFGVIEMFSILTGMVVMTRPYTNVKSYQTVYCVCVIILIVLPSMATHLICYM